MSTLKFWNKSNSESSDTKTETKNAKNGQRNWLHAPDSLSNGHVAYLVKYLGNTPVDQPKGIEVVKEAIRRLQFTQQIKKAEGGNNVKMKKVEITISIDGVAIQEPRTNNILHQFPLHKISYCADEKGVKKFFSFIAKMGTSVQANTNGDSTSINTSSSSSVGSVTGTAEESHECFVFISNKLASDITLTIGQAFDLAYRRSMSDSGKQFEISKLQSHNKILEGTVDTYRKRLREVSEILSKPDLDKLLLRLGVRDICEVQVTETTASDGNKTPDLGIDVSQNDDQLLIETSPKNTFAPIVPPRNQITNDALKPTIGTKLEGLNLLDSDSDSEFDPRAEETGMTNGSKMSNDLFGFEPKMNGNVQQLFSSGHFTDGTTKTMTHGPTSPPPLLAPPPKVATPRRTNGAQDLFGSDPFAPISAKPLSDCNGMNEESRNIVKDLSAFRMDHFDATLNQESSISNNFECETDSAKNPFLDSPKKAPSTTKLFQKPTEMFLSSKTTRYDVFKNDFPSNGHEATEKVEKKTEMSMNDPFQDFAIAAFSEFKIDKSSSIHEFSNKLFQNGHQKDTEHLSSQQSRSMKMKNGINIDDFSIESFDPLAK
jgi:hypothetical protein